MTAMANAALTRSRWQTIVVFSLAFWFSSSLLLDLVVMPGLYASGMMTQADFATAGYSIFWIFNRIELLWAALAFTGVLILNQARNSTAGNWWTAPLAAGLLAIALLYTYGLTPEMSGLGLQLDLFNPPSNSLSGTMAVMQYSYLGLELVKLLGAGFLLTHCYRAK